MRLRRIFLLSLSLLSLGLPAAADIEGIVLSAGGTAIEHARVDLLEPASHAFTDAAGRFVLAGAEAPAQLVVSHPRFHTQTVDLGAGTSNPLRCAPLREASGHVGVWVGLWALWAPWACGPSGPCGSCGSCGCVGWGGRQPPLQKGKKNNKYEVNTAESCFFA